MKKTLSVLLAVLLFAGLLASCGGSESSSATPSSEASSIPAAQPVNPGSESEATPEDPAQVLGAYLTGLEKGADYPDGKRVTGVMVNNIIGSRPTRGLSEAQVVYEMRVEGGITRFMAVFEDYAKIPMVGSVRSARDQFFQMLVPSWGFYVHDGPNQNQPVIQMIQDNEYHEFDLTPADYGQTLTWRDPGRAGMKTEYTEYTDGEHIAQVVADNNLDDERTYNSTIFNFMPFDGERRILEGGKSGDNVAEEVAVVHSESYRNLFEYDAGSGRYMMSQFGSSGGMEPAIDENNGDQIGFDNMLVLFTTMYNYTNSELVFVGYDSGIGYYFNGGEYEVVRWKKGGPQEPLQVFRNDTTETPAFLNPGTSYIAMVDDVQLEDFANAVEGAGDAQAMAEGGTINPNEQETAD